MDTLTHWQPLLLWVSGLSLLSLVVTLIAVPWVITRLPQDYFVSGERNSWDAASGEPLFARVVEVLKNVLGALLLLLGLIMLVTPGQGVLTILVGLMLMNFPGKYRLERKLVQRTGVMRALNWLRVRSGRPPFEEPS